MCFFPFSVSKVLLRIPYIVPNFLSLLYKSLSNVYVMSLPNKLKWGNCSNTLLPVTIIWIHSPKDCVPTSILGARERQTRFLWYIRGKKVKLSLCLINYALCHKDIWGGMEV
jgi:hypothetical protein